MYYDTFNEFEYNELEYVQNALQHSKYQLFYSII